MTISLSKPTAKRVFHVQQFNKTIPWTDHECLWFQGCPLVYLSDGKTIDTVLLPGGVKSEPGPLYAKGAKPPIMMRRTRFRTSDEKI